MKKRKMNATQTNEAAESSSSGTAAAASDPAAAAAAATAAGDVTMADAAGDAGEGEDEPSASPAAVSTATAEEVAELVAALPSALSLLQRMSADIVTCKTPQFHVLRKEVLRLAAALQNVTNTSNTDTHAEPCGTRRGIRTAPSQRRHRSAVRDACSPFVRI